MIAERDTQVEPHLRLEETIGLERRLVAASWQNHKEMARVADCLGLGIDDFLDRTCGVAVGYLRECAGSNRRPSWADAAPYLERYGVSTLGELYFVLVDAPVPEDDSVTDLVQLVQRAANERADEDCRYVTRRVTLLILHALSCPRCRRCAECLKSQQRPRRVCPPKRQRKATVYV